MTEQLNSGEIVIEIYQNLTNLRGLSMGLRGDPRFAGCGLFWESQSKKKWKLEGDALLLPMLHTSHIIKGIVKFLVEPYGESGLVAAPRLTRVEWPDAVTFHGTAANIAEFQAGFSQVFAESVMASPARHYRNHWGE